MSQTVFVYGTLMTASGYPASQRLAAEGQFIGQAWLRGLLYDFGKWPGLIFSSTAGDKVFGELHRLANGGETLRWMDIYEGISANNQNHEYRRTLTTVFRNDGSPVEAWVYAYRWPLENGMLLRSGRWERRFRETDARSHDAMLPQNA